MTFIDYITRLKFFLLDFIEYYGGWQAILIAIISYYFIIKLEKIKNKISSDSSEKIEKVKNELSKEASLLNSLLINSFYGHQKFIERRIISLDLFWKSLLNLQKCSDPIYLLFQVLTDEEIENKMFNDRICEIIDSYDLDGYMGEINKINYSIIENRLYIGEKLFFLYSAYRTILFRSIHLLTSYKKLEKVTLWYKDISIRSLLDQFIDEKTLNDIINKKVSTLDFLRVKIEEIILIEVSFIIEGRSSINDGMKNYTHLIAEVEKIKTKQI